MFQSTRPRGARRTIPLAMVLISSFQSTRPRGARPTLVAAVLASFSGFNPRARVGRDPYTATYSRNGAEFQSTRPRGARHFWLKFGCLVSVVSIHAPAWGATPPMVQVALTTLFQSTRPRGARPRTSCISALMLTFQSTRPRGARLGRRSVLGYRYQVSIHAPAWGAT